MRRACIDIGSNTTRLLVADRDGDELVEVHQERAFTCIGQALDADGAIPAGKLAEVVAAVAGQLAGARRLGATEIRCVATAGVRRAGNGERLVALIGAACEGLEVQVLSGEDEARLAFIGAAWGLRRSGILIEGALGVADVGGGSSELVVGEPPDSVSWCESLPLGSADLAGVSRAEARGRVDAAFGGIDPPTVTTVVAVGGSASSLPRLVGTQRLDVEAFERSLELLAQVPPEVIAARFGLDAQRVRLLPGGLLILQEVARRFRAPVIVGSAGLREGLLLER